jgi:hypothetical protein
VLFAAYGGYENSFQSGLRNSAGIRARQHRCCECPARDRSAGFNEQLIRAWAQTDGPPGPPSAPSAPLPGNWRGFSMRNWGEPGANTVSHVCCADYWVRFGKACNHKQLAVTAIEGGCNTFWCWRPRRESNPRTRICSPLRRHSATRPHRRAM